MTRWTRCLQSVGSNIKIFSTWSICLKILLATSESALYANIILKKGVVVKNIMLIKFHDILN